MTAPLDRHALDQLFLEARTHSHWASDPVPEATLRRLYELLRMGPTSANCCPARFVFCASEAARRTLAACVSEGNAAKVLKAPVTVIVGMDEKFYDRLPELFPHNPDARIGVLGRLVGRVDAGEIADQALAGLAVEALGVAPLRLLERRVHEHLDELALAHAARAPCAARRGTAR
jgi:nitroreductase